MYHLLRLMMSILLLSRFASGFAHHYRASRLRLRPISGAAEDELGKSLPPKLIQHIRSVISNSVQPSIVQAKPNVVEEVLTQIISTPVLGEQPKYVFEKGTEIAEALKLISDHGFVYSDHGKIDLQRLLDIKESKRKSGEQLFKNITQHHTKLTQCDWSEATDNLVSLEDYSHAAVRMGQRKWVQEGNQWMSDFAIKFFKKGGARKYHMHSLEVAHNKETGMPLSNEVRNELKGKLSNEVIPTGQKIRLLDVGSCYNPFCSKSDEDSSSSLLEVTALDLYPAHPSVLQCDFLDLSVGGPDSAPLTLGPTAQSSSSSSGSSSAVSLDPSQMTKLLQLPAGSFDVVTMSLVLNYLPTPSHRDAMIEKARQLLNHSPDLSNPLRRGLLLLVEKNSIFGKSSPHGPNLGPDRNELLENWKQAICARGFELVHNRVIIPVNSTSKVHMYAFATSDISHETVTSKPSLWIRSDFHREKLVARGELQESRPVGIVGGGLGGSALALALQRVGLPFVVFEKDSHFNTRKQGYALTMQQAGTALREFGLGSAVAETGVVSTAHYSYDKTGRQIGAYGRALLKKKANSNQLIHIDEPDVDTDGCAMEESTEGNILTETTLKPLKGRFNIHIPRQKLREIVLNQIEPKTILWNKKLTSFEQCKETNDSFVKAYFEDGTHYSLSALVGADGIYSSVRKHLLDPEKDVPLKYLGQMVILGISDTPSNNTVLSSGTYAKGDIHSWTESDLHLLRHSLCQTQWLDGETRMFSMPFDAYRTMWQLSYLLSEKEAVQLSTYDLPYDSQEECDRQIGIKLKSAALHKCQDWTKSVLRLIENTNDTLMSGHPVYDREPITPELMGDASMGGDPKLSLVTLLGDAAHPMSPFKGQGANVALLDAHSLYSHLIDCDLYYPGRRPLAEAVREYEKEMCERCSSKVLLSRAAATYLHSTDALAEGNITRASAAQRFSKQEKSSYIC